MTWWGTKPHRRERESLTPSADIGYSLRATDVRRLMHTVLTVLAVLVVVLVGLRLMENSMIYFPVKYPEGFWQPSEFGVAVEDCFFSAEDGVKLHGWFAAQAGARDTLLWCHGNAGNITHRLDNLERLLRHVKLNVFIFDYRGYGRSEGKPDEAGLYQDARAAYDYLTGQKQIAPERMVIFGRSLGGAVAVNLALERPCAGLIIESSFTSAKDMAKRMFPFLPVQYFMGVRFDSDAKIARLHIPLLILHGTVDDVVPYDLGQKLFAAANEPKEFYSIRGASHNDTYLVGGGAYFAKLQEFIDRLAGER